MRLIVSSLNKVMLLGNLGRDPELKNLPSGQQVCEFSIATSENVGTGDSRKEVTEWHRIVVWGKQAELCARYLKKGRTAFVEGRIRTREWQDKDGNKRSTVEIVASDVRFIGGDRGASTGGGDERRPERSAPPAHQNDRPPAESADQRGGFHDDDDIPF
jgi:single-strand DNA-binding protein